MKKIGVFPHVKALGSQMMKNAILHVLIFLVISNIIIMIQIYVYIIVMVTKNIIKLMDIFAILPVEIYLMILEKLENIFMK